MMEPPRLLPGRAVTRMQSNDVELVDDVEESCLDDEIQLSQFPQTTPIDEAAPRQCPP